MESGKRELDDKVQASNIRKRRAVAHSIMVSNNDAIRRLLNVSLQLSRNDLQVLLQDFWRKFEDTDAHDRESAVNEVFCMYILHHVYKSSKPSLTIVSKAISAYLKVIGPTPALQMLLEGNGTSELCVSQTLHVFLSKCPIPYTSWNKNTLSCLLFDTAGSGQYALLQFLIKYRKLPLQLESITDLKTMASNYLWWRHQILNNVDEIEEQVFEMTEEEFNWLLGRMQRSREFSFRRSVLILFTINMLVEFQMGELHNFEILMERCHLKRICLRTLTMTTTEPFIAWIDIDKFLTSFFNETRKDVIFRKLQDALGKLSPESLGSCNARSLKDLARCKVRECLQDSVMLPIQVPELKIPTVLEEYILFDNNQFWDILKKDRRLSYLQQLVGNTERRR